jgi:hypothetical protein
VTVSTRETAEAKKRPVASFLFTNTTGRGRAEEHSARPVYLIAFSRKP